MTGALDERFLPGPDVQTAKEAGSNPLFSIIVPAYNAAPYIAWTIRSILTQTVTDWELLVVDDGSSDQTAQIVMDFAAADPRIRLLQQPNQKQAAARNTGMRVARGRWIAFLDADDLWLPDKLQVQLECIRSDASLDVLFTDGFTYFEERRGRSAYHWPVALGRHEGHELYRSQLGGNSIPNLSVVMKREWIDKVGLQDEDAAIAGCEDHDYWLRLMRAGATFQGIDRKLFIYRVHAGNFSANVNRQIYRSALVRMKNFDQSLLKPDEGRAFWTQIQKTGQHLYENGYRQWGREISGRPNPFDVRTTSGDRSRLFFQRFALALKLKPRAWFGGWIKRMREATHFHIMTRLNNNHRQLYEPYVRRLLGDRLVVEESLRIDTTARIGIERPGGRIVAHSLSIGDCSRINILGDSSELLAGRGVFIARFCNFNVGGRVVLGDNTLFNNYCSVNCHQEIIIGSNTWFGEGVRMYDHNHRYRTHSVPFVAQGFANGSIVIGSDVWVGANCVILKDVSIGDGCVIGANNVVYKSLPPNTLVVARAMVDMRHIERENFDGETR